MDVHWNIWSFWDQIFYRQTILCQLHGGGGGGGGGITVLQNKTTIGIHY